MPLPKPRGDEEKSDFINRCTRCGTEGLTRQRWCKACWAEYQRGWRVRNKKRSREIVKASRERNIDKFRQYRIRYDATDKAKQTRKRSIQNWRKRNPERWREIVNRQHHRRAVQLYGGEYDPSVSLKSLREKNKDMCGICGQFVRSEDASIDHIQPVVLGGSHTWNNIQLAHKICNSRKGARRAVA